MKKAYSILNLLVVLYPFLEMFIDKNQGKAISSVDIQATNLFSPAGYAFAIWFFIYLGLLIFSIHQIRVAFGKTKDEDTLLKVGPFLILALLINQFWSYQWQQGNIELSPYLLFASFACLMVIVVRLQMQIVEAPKAVRRYTWLPISLFSGWMMAASVVGLSTYLSYLGLGSDATYVNWTVAVIIVVMLLYVYMLFTRNMVVFALVGVWTLVAIAIDHWSNSTTLVWTALSAATLLIMAILLKVLNKKNFAVIF
ncbi:hypothetical protein P8625_13770 [Tenacibaculum tangerinum]|uniref:Tryptophan-rich sensory protein n=1 Tax=Tenacibaculum tangerinum TaxID=3038772 RepID=A0ABY8L5C6_9FLAO|nr:hypothetical protein [Tenacibaculum tangerinum]WGH75125.1 hypothetical protein P8625_13770 [Tenacibaculum tangerinum]